MVGNEDNDQAMGPATGLQAVPATSATQDQTTPSPSPASKPPLPPMRLGKEIYLAVVGVFILAAVLSWTAFWISQESNAPGCATAFKFDANKDIVFPDDAKNGVHFTLHGHLCLALNAKRYFGPNFNQAQIRDKSFLLFIDGKNTGLKTHGYANLASPDWLSLTWKIEVPTAQEGTESTAAWKSTIGQASLATGTRKVTIGIGDDQTPSPVFESPAELDLFDPKMVWFGALDLLLIATGLFMASRKTGLFRDGEGRIADSTQPDGVVLTPYSLAKIQMGIWMLLTIGGFLLIWVTTGQTSGIISPDIYALMGVQLGTGLAAVYIDKDKPASATTGSFLKDILSSDGVSLGLQRIQMFAWTLILGAIFIWSIIYKLSFPVFDTNLLVLIGFVNANYLGFKFPENNKAV